MANWRKNIGHDHNDNFSDGLTVRPFLVVFFFFLCLLSTISLSWGWVLVYVNLFLTKQATFLRVFSSASQLNSSITLADGEPFMNLWGINLLRPNRGFFCFCFCMIIETLDFRGYSMMRVCGVQVGIKDKSAVRKGDVKSRQSVWG